jgi:uncharacterized protein YjdB
MGVNAFADNNQIGVTYEGYAQNIGWQSWVSDGSEAGTDGQGLRVEALKIKLTNAPTGARIKYQTYVQNIGWQDATYDGQEAGTDGKGLRVEAIKISLENMPGYSVQYQAHVQNVGWQPWVSDNEEAGTDGRGLRIEAIRIKIVPIVNTQSVTLNKSTETLTAGQTDTLVANVGPENATYKQVMWSSSNNSVATVDNTGKITALKQGNASIIATTVNGGKVASCSVTVNPPILATGISINKTTDELKVGDTDNLAVDVQPDNTTNKQISWTTSNSSVATVDSNGKVIAVSAGTATITGTTIDGSNKNVSCNVNVINNGTDGISVSYDANVQNIGWQNWVSDGENAGTIGQSLMLEGLKVRLINAPAGARIKYETHVQNIGWESAVYDGGESGAFGKSLRVEALKISLENMPGYSVEYQTQVQNIGWQSWVKDDEIAGTEGQSLRIEAIKIKIVKNIDIQYQVHVQNIGWENYVNNNTITGTEGQPLRIEAINMKLINAPAGASIKYETHVQNLGWQSWAQDGQEAGTDGKSLRIEALKVQLVNAPGYSVQYQVYVENLGWQSWVQDGQEAGTDGKGLRIEGIRIRVFPNLDGTMTNPQSQPSYNTMNSLTYKLGSYLDSNENIQSVNEQAVKLHDGNTSNNCVFFSSEALRRIGFYVPKSMANTAHYVPYLISNGWTKQYNKDLLQIGDICFTINDSTGHPTHTYVFMGWLNPDDHTLAYVADNQGSTIHIRSMIDAPNIDAFSFFVFK